MLSLYGGRGMQIALRFVEVDILNHGASPLLYCTIEGKSWVGVFCSCIGRQLALVDAAESKPSTVCC